MPIISVIVPVYEVESYLHDCIGSILSQAFTEFELILVDDGSLDNCGAICDEYERKDRRIHVLHQKNSGVSVARNTGIDWVFCNSDSEWICFIDSDDWVHPFYLEHLYNAAKKEHTLISSCSYQKTDKRMINDVIPKSPVVVSPQDDYSRDGNAIIAYAWGRLFHRSLWKDIRFPVNCLWEDVATIYQVLFSVSQIAYVDELLYYYFVNPKGIVLRSWNPKRLDEFAAYEKQLAYFSTKPEFRRVYKVIQRNYIKAISYSYFMEQKSELSPADKKRYAKFIQRKMRKALHQYGRTTGLSFRDNTDVFDTAYPRVMQIYWFIKYRFGRKREKE